MSAPRTDPLKHKISTDNSLQGKALHTVVKKQPRESATVVVVVVVVVDEEEGEEDGEGADESEEKGKVDVATQLINTRL